MARGRAKGSKNQMQLPSSYAVGEGAVNFYLAILARARADNADMWVDFKKSEFYEGQNKDALQIAWWVCQYINEVKDE